MQRPCDRKELAMVIGKKISTAWVSSEAGGPHVGCDLSVEVMAGLCLKYGWGFWVQVLGGLVREASRRWYLRMPEGGEVGWGGNKPSLTAWASIRG